MSASRSYYKNSKLRRETKKVVEITTTSPLENRSELGYGKCTCGAQCFPLFENLVWLSSKETAIYLRKFLKNGEPSVGAIRAMVCRGQIRARRFQRRLYFLKRDLDRQIETSALTGGF